MSIPRVLVGLGILLIVLGGLAAVMQRFPWSYSWFGNLPGDIRYESKGATFFAPISSMLVVSGLLSIAAWLVRSVGR